MGQAPPRRGVAYRALAADTSASEAAVAARREEVIDAIARGDMTAEAAAISLEEVRSLTATAPAAKDLANAGKRRILRGAYNQLYAAGDTLLTDVLDPIVGRHAQAIVDSAPHIGDVTDDADIVRAPGPVHAAWRAMTTAREGIATAQALAHQLRMHGITSNLPPPHLPPEAWRWRVLDPVYAKVGRGLHPNLELAALIEAGAGPATLTCAQVVELHLEPPPVPKSSGGSSW